jgi:glycosyltransferase involved in cell wall biosynthesis
MVTSPPFFSIIIPCYNAEKTVSATLESIQQQRCRDFEIIAVDDGSLDGTKALLDRYVDRLNLRIIQQSNKGLGFSRNIAISIASGKYLAFLDSDDLWLPDKLLLAFNFLQTNPVDIFCHDEYLIKQNKITGIQRYGPHTKYLDLLFKGNCLSPSAVCAKTSFVRAVGGFSVDPRGHGVEDYDLWLRMLKAGATIKFEHQTLGVCRVHHSNMSSATNFRDKEDFFLEKHFNALDLQVFNEKITKRRSIQLSARGWDAFLKFEFKVATNFYWKAFKLHPCQPKLWKYLFLGIFQLIKIEVTKRCH